MKEYFRLFSYCELIREHKNSALYNKITGQIISLTKDKSNMLYLAESNIKLKDIEKCNFEFFNKLEDMGLGTFLNKPVYIDKFKFGLEETMKKYLKINTEIRNAQIELTTECNLNCVFCKKDDNTLYRKTGCKRWKTSDNKLSVEDWENVIDQLISMSCQEITFISGEPLLEFELLKSLVKLSKNKGIINFTIYTNGILLDDDKISFVKENNIKLVIQLPSIDKDVYTFLTGNGNLDILLKKLAILKENNIDFSILHLITRYNDCELDAYNILSQYSNKIVKEFIYPKPDNNFFSGKIDNYIYNYKNKLLQPNEYIYSYLKENNCCYGQKIGITCDGKVLPCIMSRTLILGNILEKKLYEILDEEYYKVRNLSKSNIEKCKVCSYRFGCFECRALEISATGEIDGMEYCELTKEMI